MFYDKLHVGFFPNRFPHYAWTVAWSAHSNLAGPRVHAYLGVTCHLHFWQNGRCLLRAIEVTRGLERAPNKSHHTTLTLEKKILPPLLSRFELSTFRSRVRRSYQQAVVISLIAVIITFKCYREDNIHYGGSCTS